MNVGAIGRIQPVLAKVEPVLTREQRANLAHPQVVVRVAKGEEADRVPALDDEVEAKGYPDADHDPFPVTVDEIENAIQALPRFKGFPAVAARGYRASRLPPMLSALHPDRRRLLGQLARFVVSGAFVTAIGVGVYAIVALVLRWHPQIGNFMAYVVAVALGYFMHS